MADPKTYKCACGYSWKVTPPALPVSAACPRCGTDHAGLQEELTAAGAAKPKRKGKGSNGG